MKNKWLIPTSILTTGLLVFASELYTTRDDCALTDGTQGTIIELSMGDWSCDGHCIEKTRNICSNLTPENIKTAYKAATDKVGFDFINDVADEYEDNALMADKLKTLRENNIAMWTFEDEEYLEEGEELELVSLDQDSYSQIYLELVKLGNAEFKYETLQGKSMNIGGYGLFTQ
ncbi:MAG: hypothetical protein R3A80_03630 [Bdellovibrionota bacterium]